MRKLLIIHLFQKTMFLFYEDKKKQWLVGPTLGSTTGVSFSTTEKTLAKCPGDPPASGTWQRKSTILGRLVSTS